MPQTIFLKGNKKSRRLKKQILFENHPKLALKARKSVCWGGSRNQVLMDSHKN